MTARINIDLSSGWNGIQTVSGRNSSHCESHFPLASALTDAYVHTCHRYVPLLPQNSLRQQQQPPLCLWRPGRLGAARPLSSCRHWLLHDGTWSSALTHHISEHFRSSQSRKQWCKSEVFSTLFLKGYRNVDSPKYPLKVLEVLHLKRFFPQCQVYNMDLFK